MTLSNRFNIARKSASLFAMACAFSFVLLISGQSVTSVSAQEDKVLAKVGERTITQADLDQAMKDMAQQFSSFPENERRARALDSLIDIQVLAALAEKEGLQNDGELKRRLELLRNRALHNGYFQSRIQGTVTEEAMRARFEEESAKVEAQKEVNARHILVKTEEDALAIIKELDEGKDFVELAKEKSTGPSGPNGGDLGFFGRGRMVPEFEEAAFKLEKGEYTKTPVKTQFGFHVIKVEDKRDAPKPTFEQSREQVRQVMLTEAYAKAVQEGREQIGAEVLDESLKLPNK
ncbi:MAG: peptidylprolyl isomerase [Pseudomonadota bacterium]